MKKTLITLLALSGIASAATTLTYWGGNRGEDLLTIHEQYNTTKYLTLNKQNQASSSIISTLKTKDNTTYDLTFETSADSNCKTPSFALNDAIYLNSVTVAGQENTYPTSLTINFGTAGSITTAQQINFGNKTTKIDLSATLTDAQLLALEQGTDVSRTLLYGGGNNGIWNFEKTTTRTTDITITNIGKEYEYVGFVTSADKIAAGQYGLLYNGPIGGTGNKDKADWVQFVIKAAPVTPGDNVPEPTTATLSLLALAGLAARRRRK